MVNAQGESTNVSIWITATNITQIWILFRGMSFGAWQNCIFSYTGVNNLVTLSLKRWCCNVGESTLLSILNWLNCFLHPTEKPIWCFGQALQNLSYTFRIFNQPFQRPNRLQRFTADLKKIAIYPRVLHRLASPLSSPPFFPSNGITPKDSMQMLLKLSQYISRVSNHPGKIQLFFTEGKRLYVRRPCIKQCNPQILGAKARIVEVFTGISLSQHFEIIRSHIRSPPPLFLALCWGALQIQPVVSSITYNNVQSVYVR